MVVPYCKILTQAIVDGMWFLMIQNRGRRCLFKAVEESLATCAKVDLRTLTEKSYRKASVLLTSQPPMFRTKEISLSTLGFASIPSLIFRPRHATVGHFNVAKIRRIHSFYLFNSIPFCFCEEYARTSGSLGKIGVACLGFYPEAQQKVIRVISSRTSTFTFLFSSLCAHL